MRIPVSLALAAATLTWAGAARAQAPLDPYEAAEPAAPPAPPAIAPAPILPAAPPAPPAPPPPPAQVIDPYGQYPAPPAYGYQPPSAGPAETASPPSYQRGYYLYSSPGQPPVYYAPPPAQFRCSAVANCACMQACGCGQRLVLRPKKRWDGIRRIGLGAHAGFLMLNQQVGRDQVTLGGAGFNLRFRSAGHFGFEIAQSFLHADYWQGAWSRDTFPFQLSMMLYLFPNRDAHHFNLYGVGGAGLIADSVSLFDENHVQVTQDFSEFELHAGLGAELRFKWFGIEADARYLWLWRAGSDDARWYGDVGGAPVQKASQGIQGNIYVSIWF